MKPATPPFLLPERVCMLWSGFAGFVLAFVARLLASGSPSEAVFSGCVGCLVAGLLGRVAGSYLNHNLRPTPVLDDSEDADSGEPEQAKPRT